MRLYYSFDYIYNIPLPKRTGVRLWDIKLTLMRIMKKNTMLVIDHVLVHPRRTFENPVR